MPVFESSRKVQLFGSSLAMTLPALFVKTNEIKKGSVGKVYFGLDGVLVVSIVDDNKTRGSLLKIIEKIDEICLNQNIKEDQSVKQE
jgi:antitoxin component of MazEF toxin-antitoxin module